VKRVENEIKREQDVKRVEEGKGREKE